MDIVYDFMHGTSTRRGSAISSRIDHDLIEGRGGSVTPPDYGSLLPDAGSLPPDDSSSGASAPLLPHHKHQPLSRGAAVLRGKLRAGGGRGVKALRRQVNSAAFRKAHIAMALAAFVYSWIAYAVSQLGTVFAFSHIALVRSVCGLPVLAVRS